MNNNPADDLTRAFFAAFKHVYGSSFIDGSERIAFDNCDISYDLHDTRALLLLRAKNWRTNAWVGLPLARPNVVFSSDAALCADGFSDAFDYLARNDVGEAPALCAMLVRFVHAAGALLVCEYFFQHFSAAQKTYAFHQCAAQLYMKTVHIAGDSSVLIYVAPFVAVTPQNTLALELLNSQIEIAPEQCARFVHSLADFIRTHNADIQAGIAQHIAHVTRSIAVSEMQVERCRLQMKTLAEEC